MKKVLIALSAVAFVPALMFAGSAQADPSYSSWHGHSVQHGTGVNGCSTSEENDTEVWATRWENGGNNDTIVYSDYPNLKSHDIWSHASDAGAQQARAWIERKNANGNYETVWGPYYTDNGIYGDFGWAVPMSEEYSADREPRVVTEIKYVNASGTSWCQTKISWHHNFDPYDD